MSRSLLPTQEELDTARNTNYQDTVRKYLLKRYCFYDKTLSLQETLDEIQFPFIAIPKKITYTENILLDLAKNPKRTNVWRAYSDEQDNYPESEVGLIFPVIRWSSMVVFHNYAPTCNMHRGFGCWVQIDNRHYCGHYYIETFKNLLDRLELKEYIE